MPGYRGHISGGSIAFAVGLLAVIPSHHPTTITMIEWLLFALAGSLFPDIDIKSKGQRYFYGIMLLLFVILSINHHYKYLTIVSILSVVPLLAKHRGIFHRLWFIIALPLLAWYIITLQIPGLYTGLFIDTLFFIIGAVSHLWLDMGMSIFCLFNHSQHITA